MEKIYIKDSLEFVDESNFADLVEREMGKDSAKYVKELLDVQKWYNNACEKQDELEDEIRILKSERENTLMVLDEIKYELDSLKDDVESGLEKINIIESIKEILKLVNDAKSFNE